MPIKYEINKNPNLIANEDELMEGYEMKDTYSFMPEFLEEVYDGPNRESLVNANNELLNQLNHKPSYQYIATWKTFTKNDDFIVEYYYDAQDNIIAFFAIKPKNERYYTRLEAVSVFQRINMEVS